MKRGAFLATGCAAMMTSRSTAGATAVDPSLHERLRTEAETHSYTTTSTSEQVVALLRALDDRGAPIARGVLARTASGGAVPYVVASRPMIATPEAARKLGRPIVLLLGGICGGEVEGKEALLALLRDLCISTQTTFLDDVVLVFAPLINPDGNDRLGSQAINRPMQNGPELVGGAENADGIDVASDAANLASPEMRGLLHFVRTWEPHLVIELRTSAGSFHDYGVTYTSALHPAAEPAQRFVRTRIVPRLHADLRNKFAIDGFLAGHFGRDHIVYAPPPAADTAQYGWFATDGRIRTLTNYLGVCGTPVLRIEGYAHDPFARRVFNVRAAVESVLGYCSENAGAIVAADAARRRESVRAIAIGGALPVTASWRGPVRWENVALSSETPRESGMPSGLKRTGTFQSAVMPMFDRYVATDTIDRPRGYLIAAPYAAAVWSHLRAHGIDSVTLERDKPCNTSAFSVAEIFGSAEVGTLAASGQWSPIDNLGGAIGELYVPSGQPMGVLASIILEPMGADGSIAQNLFAGDLRVGDTFPLRRVLYDAATSIADRSTD